MAVTGTTTNYNIPTSRDSQDVFQRETQRLVDTLSRLGVDPNSQLGQTLLANCQQAERQARANIGNFVDRHFANDSANSANLQKFDTWLKQHPNANLKDILNELKADGLNDAAVQQHMTKLKDTGKSLLLAADAVSIKGQAQADELKAAISTKPADQLRALQNLNADLATLDKANRMLGNQLQRGLQDYKSGADPQGFEALGALQALDALQRADSSDLGGVSDWGTGLDPRHGTDGMGGVGWTGGTGETDGASDATKLAPWVGGAQTAATGLTDAVASAAHDFKTFADHDFITPDSLKKVINDPKSSPEDVNTAKTLLRNFSMLDTLQNPQDAADQKIGLGDLQAYTKTMSLPDAVSAAKTGFAKFADPTSHRITPDSLKKVINDPNASDSDKQVAKSLLRNFVSLDQFQNPQDPPDNAIGEGDLDAWLGAQSDGAAAMEN